MKCIWKKVLPVLAIACILVGCSEEGTDYARNNQDKEAKEMLQGMWINADDGNLAMMAEGDTIFYADTSSLPVCFWIYQDSLYMQGKNLRRYLITKQANHLFKFINQSGDEIKLIKRDNEAFLKAFHQYRPYALNIFRTIDSDTVAVGGNITYTCKTHVEPTSERMIATSFNNEGVEVENMYLDNDARLDVNIGSRKIYSHHFRKQEFSTMVPKLFMEKSILRDIQYDHADSAAVYFDAIIGVPDASSAFVVELKVSRDGKLTKRLR